jgi:hypothetical protein
MAVLRADLTGNINIGSRGAATAPTTLGWSTPIDTAITTPITITVTAPITISVTALIITSAITIITPTIAIITWAVAIITPALIVVIAVLRATITSSGDVGRGLEHSRNLRGLFQRSLAMLKGLELGAHVVQLGVRNSVHGDNKSSVVIAKTSKNIAFELIIIDVFASSSKLGHKAFHLGDVVGAGHVEFLGVGQLDAKHIHPGARLGGKEFLNCSPQVPSVLYPENLRKNVLVEAFCQKTEHGLIPSKPGIIIWIGDADLLLVIIESFASCRWCRVSSVKETHNLRSTQGQEDLRLPEEMILMGEFLRRWRTES